MLAFVWASLEVRSQSEIGSILERALNQRGLELESDGVVWLEGEHHTPGFQPALFLAHKENELPDLYYGEVRPARKDWGARLVWLTNASRTSSAAETQLVRAGSFAAYASKVNRRYDAITMLDVRGERGSETKKWPWHARFQNAVTNLQDTGRFDGFTKRRFNIDPPADSVRLKARGDTLWIQIDGEEIAIHPSENITLPNTSRLKEQWVGKAQPGTITWVVDTVRRLIGRGPIEWLEHRVFALEDRWDRFQHRYSKHTTEQQIVRELGLSTLPQRKKAELVVTDPEVGWPPARLTTLLQPHLRSEGQWIPVIDDAFVQRFPNAPPPFYQTFIRVDPEREYNQVYITAWDPRQVQLHIVSGTREPESATGETGTGLIPRNPEVLSRLVGAFNGGFQALHGEFGMMADGRVYLPPKPWAATVAVFEDGQVGIGSWPGAPEGIKLYEERWALQQVPKDMIAFRQNLTSVTEDNRINPWGRWWWGAAPLDSREQTYMHRSGLCVTREGFFAYFWGASLGPDELGRAMLQTRCARSMHLDMNSVHTGFEFYNIRETFHPFAPLNRPLTDAEFEGPVPDAPKFTMRVRKAVRSMNPMRFPRYIRRDPRDFFYLTLKPVLPGAPLEGNVPASFTTSGLPHSGWPYAFARTAIEGSDRAKTWLVRIDPRRAIPAPIAPEGSTEVLGLITHPSADADPHAYGLFEHRSGLRNIYEVGSAPTSAKLLLRGDHLHENPTALAALGVDESGFLVYGERESESSPLLPEVFQSAQVNAAISLNKSRLVFYANGTYVGLDGFERTVDPSHALALMADRRPAGTVLFPDTKPRPYHVWAKMQDTRVRYFREGPPRFLWSADAGVQQQKSN